MPVFDGGLTDRTAIGSNADVDASEAARKPREDLV
jgi:hypothetical protein